MAKSYIDADKLIAEIERWRDKAKEKYNKNPYSMGRCDALAEFRNHIVSLQQEQPEVDLEKVVEFECVGKKVKMTIQELINYYIDSECCDVADECGF